jgi:hypothetical protein
MNASKNTPIERCFAPMGATVQDHLAVVHIEVTPRAA